MVVFHHYSIVIVAIMPTVCWHICGCFNQMEEIISVSVFDSDYKLKSDISFFSASHNLKTETWMQHDLNNQRCYDEAAGINLCLHSSQTALTHVWPLFMVKVCKIALVLRDEPFSQWDNRLPRRGATWLKHKPRNDKYNRDWLCGGSRHWRSAVLFSDITCTPYPTTDWPKGYLPRFKRLTRSIMVSIMTDCVHSRNEPDSWTAHDNSACDLRGIWSRPVSDPGLSVVTKHPSGSTNSA